MLNKKRLKKLFAFSPMPDLPDKIKALEKEILKFAETHISQELTIEQIVFLWGTLKDPDLVKILRRKTEKSLQKIDSIYTVMRGTVSTTNEELKNIFRKRAEAIQKRKNRQKINPFKK